MMKRKNTRAKLVLALLLLGGAAIAHSQDAASTTLKDAKLGSTRNVHAFGPTLLCGQPSEQDFALAKQRGVKVVITLRLPNEIRWDEAKVVKENGMEFHALGFQKPGALTDAILDKSLKLLANSKQRPVMLHCASANRVGAVWMAHRVLNDNVPLEKAAAEAKEVGLRSPPFEAKVRDYIRRANP